MSLEGFEEFSFTHDGATRTVYKRGNGPGVVAIHAIPGITTPVADFARRVAADGFSVYLPHLVGTPGKAVTAAYMAGQLVRACIAREFSVLARNESSPITNWLRALCRKAHSECGGPGVGTHLGLLGQYFPGYRVTWPGAFVGLFYGIAVGAVLGWLLAWVYNRLARLRNAPSSAE